MSPVAALTRRDLLILNIVYDGGTRGSGANHLLAFADIDLDAIYALVRHDYLTGPTREDLRYGRLPDDGGYEFKLTPSGRRAVEGDPVSMLLRHVLRLQRAGNKRDRQLFRLHHVGLNFGTIQLAWDSGYLTVHYAGDERECHTLGDYEFRHARDFLVRVTSKARDHAIG